MPPEVQDILLLAIMNPATLVVGYWLGRRADQMQKLIIAAFAAAFAGTFYAWVLMRFGFTAAQPKLLSGIFIASGVIGLAWSWLGHWTRRHRGGT